jgi:formylglycine-generating enzyme required for sulfatase activity
VWLTLVLGGTAAVLGVLGVVTVAFAQAVGPDDTDAGAGRLGAATAALAAAQAGRPPEGIPCPGNGPTDEMVRVGPLCVDKYEASVWSEPRGRGSQYPQSLPRYPATFPVNGNWTEPLYAASRKGVGPATFLTWFQAQQACALAGKRLLTNAEWQMAAAGTPDPGTLGNGVTECNTNSTGSVLTGAAANCRSNWGVHDMVGNVQEWVADWIQGPGNNGSTVSGAFTPLAMSIATPAYGGDWIGGINEAFHLEAPQTGPNSADATPDAMPAGIVRGGMWSSGTQAGVFFLEASHTPTSLDNATGFRCAR